MSLANRLRNLRVTRRLRQVDVATRAGISRPHYGEIERGRVPPPPPRHALYRVIAKLSRTSAEPLRKAARFERRVLVDGLPWRPRK